MTPDTFMDTFTLDRNSLEKQDTQFCEVFPIEKGVVIAFRISHQSRGVLKRPEARNFIRKETLVQVFSSEFFKISKNTFLQNTSG